MRVRVCWSGLLAPLMMSLPVGALSQSVEDVPGSPLEGRLRRSAPDGAWSADEPGGRSFTGSLSVRELLTRPLVDVDDAGRAWVRTRDLRAVLDGQGLTLLPVFGPDSPREWPVRLEVESVRRGQQQLGRGARGGPQARPDELELEREDLREVYRLDAAGIEQTFVFDRLEGQGELVVRMAVETELEVQDLGSELRFLHPELGGISYGSAFVLDASGRREAIERRLVDGGIELVVPASFLTDAVLPVTIDPPITSFTSGFGVADDRSPDVVWCGRTNRYLVVWEEFTSAANADVYLTSFDWTGGGQGPAVAIEQGDQDWRTPRIAYAHGPDRALVVASVDLGSGGSRVRGRLVDVPAEQPAGNAFTISTEGNDKLYPDVGGTTHDGLLNAWFHVVWTHVSGPGDSRIESRGIDWDGSPTTGVQPLSDWVDGSTQSTISNSLGNLPMGTDYWTVAWIDDPDADGYGQVWARRILWNGNRDIGGGRFLVDATTVNTTPSVTSQLDEPLDVNGERPSILAYARRFVSASHPGGFQHSIYARAVTFTEAHERISISLTLEDFDAELDQVLPSIASDGHGFTLAYSEEDWAGIGSGNLDLYLVSGNVAERDGFVGLALSERHQLLAETFAPERFARVCTMQDGEADGIQDDGAVLWVRETAAQPGFGLLAGATFDNPTLQGNPERAVGVQYCDALPNSVGTFGGRTSTWAWMRGTGSVADPHTAVAVDLPPFATTMLVVSPASGNVPFAGGSFGRLCLGGSFGRYAGQIASSGASGLVSVAVDPLALPQPTGPTAALPGQSWYFQFWHRDSLGGVSGSNFSNGLRVVFRP